MGINNLNSNMTTHRKYTDLEPSEHEFPRWELGFANLVSDNEGPYETKN